MIKRDAPSPRRGKVSAVATVELSSREVQLLARVATHYQRAMGPMRLLVRLTASAEIKSKYRFVVEESKWLKQFAQATHEQMSADGVTSAPVSFTPAALIAFWGRLLTQLNSRRSRRRMSQQQVGEQEVLAAKLQAAAADLCKVSPDAVARVLDTRRPTEAEWMREKLPLLE